MFKIYIKKTRKIITRETSFHKVQEWLHNNAEKEPAGWIYKNQVIDFVWCD